MRQYILYQCLKKSTNSTNYNTRFVSTSFKSFQAAYYSSHLIQPLFAFFRGGKLLYASAIFYKDCVLLSCIRMVCCFRCYDDMLPFRGKKYYMSSFHSHCFNASEIVVYAISHEPAGSIVMCDRFQLHAYVEVAYMADQRLL